MDSIIVKDKKTGEEFLYNDLEFTYTGVRLIIRTDVGDVVYYKERYAFTIIIED